MFTSLRRRFEKRALYNRTLSELRAMPQGTASDLALSPDEYQRVAWHAVYGK